MSLDHAEIQFVDVVHDLLLGFVDHRLLAERYRGEVHRAPGEEEKARGAVPQEAVLFQDGVRLRADAWCSDPGKVRRMSPRAQQGIIELMASLAA